MAKLGINAKLYRNTGTYEATNLSEVTLISDLTVNVVWDEAPADARESRVKQVLKTMLGLDITGRMKKKPLDANYEAFMNALLSDDTMDLFVLDGDFSTVGVRGWRADFLVFSGTEDQAMSNSLYEDLVLKPFVEDHGILAVKVEAGPTFTYSTPGVDGGTFT